MIENWGLLEPMFLYQAGIDRTRCSASTKIQVGISSLIFGVALRRYVGVRRLDHHQLRSPAAADTTIHRRDGWKQ